MKEIKHKYYVKTKEIKNESKDGRKYWSYTLVEIFDRDGDKKVGEYTRKYPNYGQSTFYPFQIGDKWFALYSEDYTCTNLMELPSCKKIGGEKSNQFGFCPVEFYVPRYQVVRFKSKIRPKDEKEEDRWLTYLNHDYQDGEDHLIEDMQEDNGEYETETSDILYQNFGFVAGCVWGDDSSWKIRHIDLKDVEAGVIDVTDKLGYIEMLPTHNLKQAIDMSLCDEVGEKSIHVATRKWFDLDSGDSDSPS